jgi:hypothetical protein
MQDRAILDHNTPGLHVAPEFTSAPDVDALAGLERANHFATNDNFRGIDFRADTSVWANRESPTGETNFSFELAIQEEFTVTGDFSFDRDVPTHGGWRARRTLRRCGARSLPMRS